MGSNFIYAILAGVLPSLIWLFFWNHEDHEQPEPKSLLAGCFLGGMISVGVALFLENFTGSFIGDQSIKYTVWAIIEEVVKFTVVAIVALKSVYNDEPIDVMIYCMAVALGFAAIENTMFIMGPLSQGDMTTSIVTGNLRFIGATLVHVVSSTVIGFGLSLTYYKHAGSKFFFWLIGLILAVAVHASFNISIMNGNSSDTLKAFGWIWGAVVIMIILFEETKAVRPRLV